jgi:ankyrin repeat protein
VIIAAINQQDQDGETGLHWAARSGRRDVVALLLAQPGIDSTIHGLHGTAVEVCLSPVVFP